MEMENTRRSLDRSTERGFKKPRLATEQPNPKPNPNGLSSASYKVSSDRDSESAYHPQPQSYQELVSQYKIGLAELTFNSKPIITNLTIIAGENLHAAKAIAATICTNILEVPSEQKLPSLYLLDSIVKNIGRYYIKYFAPRLPEVFCKAYRQVEPSVHQSMRHLFGTWKGVFPPQSLQMIEKELGFALVLNGSSSATATSRPDSQLQRPPHSIHVNPKYLERQCLQQSSTAKGMANDTTTPLANSTENLGRPDRAAGVGAGRPWVDPTVKIQLSHKEAPAEPVHEKKVGALYRELEYGSEVSRTLGLGSRGMIAEQGHNKPWHGPGSGVAKLESGQRNGLSVKHVPNSTSSKSASAADLHRQPSQSITSRSDNGMSTSWKNSEEEEFLWDIHSRLSDQDVANLSDNSRKYRWTRDGSEKMEVGNHPREPQREIRSRFDREPSLDSLSAGKKEQATFGHHLSSSSGLQELNSRDGILSEISSTNVGHEEGHSATLGGLPASTNSSHARMPVQSYKSSSHIGTSGIGHAGILGQEKLQSLESASSEQSTMRQHPPLPSFPARYPHKQLHNLAEQEFQQSEPLSLPDIKVTYFSGKLLPSNVQPNSFQKLEPEDLLASPSRPSFQTSHQDPFSRPQWLDSKQSEPFGQTPKPHPSMVSIPGNTFTLGSSASENSNPITAETSGRSSTSNLSAAVVKSGIISNVTTGGLTNQCFEDVGRTLSESNFQPCLPAGPPPSQFTSPVKPRATPASVSATSSHDNTTATLTVGHRKDENPPSCHPPPLSTQTSNEENEASNLISNLLSSLVSKGLISASKSETSSLLPCQVPTLSQKQNPRITNPSSTPVSSVVGSSASPHSSTIGEASPMKPDAKSSTALTLPMPVEVENLIGLDFKADVIREIHLPVISALFDDFPHQCSICGLQLKLEEQLPRHLEWHTFKKAEPDSTNCVTRRWYGDSGDWISGKAGLPLRVESSDVMDKFGRTSDENEFMVPADEDQCVCLFCGELFEDYYSQERNRWMFRGAVHVTIPWRDDEIGPIDQRARGPIVHVNCMSESSIHDLRLNGSFSGR